VVTVHESTAVAVAFKRKHVLQYVIATDATSGRRRCTRTLPTLDYLDARSALWPFARAGRSAAFVAAQLRRPSAHKSRWSPRTITVS